VDDRGLLLFDAATTAIVRSTASGLSDMLSMPHSTRNLAKSG
jgi:hypothetical protein